MRTTVFIDSMQCENCKSFLDKEIQNYKGISKLQINLQIRSVSFDYKTHNAIEGLRMYLKKIGYPITKDPSIIEQGLNSIKTALTEMPVADR